MKKWVFAGLLALLPVSQGNAQAQSLLYLLGGDGSYLGEISDSRVKADSICNQVGDYGGKVGQMSIFNQVGEYGSRISDYSAYNPRAQNPPLLVEGSQPRFFVTKNRRFDNRIDPDFLYYKVCER